MFGGLFDLKALGMRAPAPKFGEKDVPDLSGKVIVITGANVGIGKESARVLLSKGAKVYAACRSEEKANKAIEEIKKSTGKDDIHFLQLDLNDIDSCIQAGKKLAGQEQRLDVALLNAGVMFAPAGSASKQGLEMQFATNVIGHYAFVKQLEPLLRQTAGKSKPGEVRVVWVSSSAHYLLPPKEGIRFSSIENVRQLAPYPLYGQSKIGNVHMARAMAKRLKDDGIVVVSLHPGNIQTNLQQHTSGIEKAAIKFLLNPVELGALTQLYASVSPEVTMDDTGGYFVPWARKHHTSHAKADDPEAIEATFAYVNKIIDEKKTTATTS